MSVRIFYSILWIVLSTKAFCQEVPKIISFQSSDYNAAHQNWMIAQDCAGYLYVANTAGILIFNGFQWQLVTLPRKHTPRALFKGSDCTIYTGGYEAFGYIDMTDRDHPRYVPIADSILNDQEIWHIFGKNDTLLFQSFSELYQFDYQKLNQIDLPGNIMFGNVVNAKFYIPKIRQGLYQFDKTIAEIKVANQLPPKSKITALSNAKANDELIIATQNRGLFKVTGKTTIQAIPSDLNERLKKEQINKMIRLSSGDYVIGTILNGVYITEDFTRIKYHINKSNGLSNNTVLCLFEDQSHNLWVGLDKGLNLLMISEPTEFYYDTQGILGTIFTSILYQKNLYFGTNQGLFKRTPDGTFSMAENSQGQIWSLQIIDGDLLCGHNTGTYQLKKDKLIQVSEITGGWWMKALGDGRILQSTYTGLILLQKHKDNWQLDTRVDGGDLLIQKFGLVDHILTGYHPNYGICLLKLSDDYGEIIERKIIERFDQTDLRVGIQLLDSEKATIIAQEEAFFITDGFNIRRMEDRDWSNLLLDETFQEDRKFHTALNAFSEIERVTKSVFYTHNKEMTSYLFGLDEGYLQVPKNWKKDTTNITPLGIDYVTVNDSLISWDDAEIDLLPRENDISIFLKTNGHFENLGSNYLYKLKGWDEEWRSISMDDQIDFYNLNDGYYQLWLSDKDKKSEQALLDFTVLPHWYESWPGWLLYGSIGLALIWFLNRRHAHNLKAATQKLKIEKEQALESERIKAKNEKLEREVIYKSKMLANSTMTLIQKNKVLHQLKEFIYQESQKGALPGLKKQKVLHLINRNMNSDKDWEVFEKNFAAVHEDFLEKLKQQHPDITAGELRLAAYIRLDLSSKEIAPLLNISTRSVENKRYRLRRRIGIGREDSLKNYLMRL